MFWAAEGKVEQLDQLWWNHTSHLLATLMNCHRAPHKGKPVEPHHLNPYAKGKPQRRKTVDKQDLALLREVFTRKKK